MITTIQNPEFGYYQVGEVQHSSKVSALIDGTARNIHPEWIFNNDIFDSHDWSVEPTESLQELYRQRAVSIRERYDYVILMYSAGSDSQTILDSFLKNNLRVDEIVVIHPKNLENTYTPDQNNYDPLNLLSEWDFTMKPRLQWIVQHYPNIKITTYDWSKNILDHTVPDGFVLERGHNLAPYTDLRNDYYRIDSIKSAVEKYDQVGIIIGIDKPRVCFHENAYRLYFLDLVTNTNGPQFSSTLRKNQLDVEFFYWHPSSCKLLAKQAHQLVRFFEMFPGFRTFVTWPIKKPANRSWYETSIRAIIYPDLNLDFFQANKFSNTTLGYDQLMFKIGLRDRLLSITKENFEYLRSVIDPKYFSKDIDGFPAFVGFITKMHPIKFV
jgi:hypothetical protein